VDHATVDVNFNFGPFIAAIVMILVTLGSVLRINGYAIGNFLCLGGVLVVLIVVAIHWWPEISREVTFEGRLPRKIQVFLNFFLFFLFFGLYLGFWFLLVYNTFFNVYHFISFEYTQEDLFYADAFIRCKEEYLRLHKAYPKICLAVREFDIFYREGSLYFVNAVLFSVFPKQYYIIPPVAHAVLGYFNMFVSGLEAENLASLADLPRVKNLLADWWLLHAESEYKLCLYEDLLEATHVAASAENL